MKNNLRKIVSVALLLFMMITISIPVFAGDMKSVCDQLIAQGIEIEYEDEELSVNGSSFDCRTSSDSGEGFTYKVNVKLSSGSSKTLYFKDNSVETKLNSLVKSEITDKSNNSFKLDNILNEGGKAVNEIAKEVKPQIDLQRASNDVPFFDTFMSRVLSVIIKIGWGLYTIFVVFSMVLVCMPVARKLCLTETGEKKDSGIGGWLAGFVTQSTLEAIEETKNPADGKPRLPIFIFIEKEAGVFAGLVIATVLIPFGLLNTIASYLVEWFTGIIG